MGKDTKERLLEAAREVFSRYDYREATVQRIAKRAGANISAINYHFGDKASLCARVLSRAFEEAGSGEPPPTLAQFPDHPAEALRRVVAWHLRGLFAKDSPLQMGARSLRDHDLPREVLGRVVEYVLRPLYERYAEILRALLPPATSEDVIRRACLSIFGQCALYRFGWPMVSRLVPELTLDDRELERIARHIPALVLHGVQTEEFLREAGGP